MRADRGKILTIWFQMRIELRLLLGILLLVLVIFAVIDPTHFLSFHNFQSMAFQLPELGLFTLAMVITLLTGGLNLSVITTANLSGIAVALVLSRIDPVSMSPAAVTILVILAVISGVLSSLLLGFLNGLLIAYVGISPILATLGTMPLYEGISLLLLKGWAISGFPKQFLIIGQGTLLEIPISLFVLISSAIVVSFVLRKKPYGLYVYMVGSNKIAAEFSGVRVRAVLLKTYLLSGLLSGIAAILMTSKYNSANAGYGADYLLLTILVAVLGGISTSGGFGRVSGILIALVILQFISSGLNILGVSSFITISVWGFLLIVLMWIENRVLGGAR